MSKCWSSETNLYKAGVKSSVAKTTEIKMIQTLNQMFVTFPFFDWAFVCTKLG